MPRLAWIIALLAFVSLPSCGGGSCSSDGVCPNADLSANAGCVVQTKFYPVESDAGQSGDCTEVCEANDPNWAHTGACATDSSLVDGTCTYVTNDAGVSVACSVLLPIPY